MSKKAKTGGARGAEDMASNADHKEFVTVTIERQLFGIPVLIVHDVLGAQRMTRIPLAPGEVAGALNLRGRIVTAIDARERLGLPPRRAEMPGMNVVVERDGELYALVIDTVGEVLSLPEDAFERNPTTLDARWREVSLGIYQLEERLLVVLDVDRFLQFQRLEAA